MGKSRFPLTTIAAVVVMAICVAVVHVHTGYVRQLEARLDREAHAPLVPTLPGEILEDEQHAHYLRLITPAGVQDFLIVPARQQLKTPRQYRPDPPARTHEDMNVATSA